jgi:hypothetical protein
MRRGGAVGGEARDSARAVIEELLETEPVPV